MSRPSLPPEYFEALYAADPDPWRFAESPYERAKYAATLAALPRPRYRNALELGCSIGVLTRALAPRCDRLLALGVAAAPLAAARARCADQPQVAFLEALLPRDWPADATGCDLILISELLYYLDAADVAALAGHLGRSLAPGGDLLLVHWTGPTDYPMSGNAAAELCIAAAAPFARLIRQARQPEYRLDLLRAMPG